MRSLNKLLEEIGLGKRVGNIVSRQIISVLNQESSEDESDQWRKFEPLINKPRAANSFGFFCGTTKTAKTKEIGELHQNIDKARDGLGEVLELAH